MNANGFNQSQAATLDVAQNKASEVQLEHARDAELRPCLDRPPGADVGSSRHDTDQTAVVDHRHTRARHRMSREERIRRPFQPDLQGIRV